MFDRQLLPLMSDVTSLESGVSPPPQPFRAFKPPPSGRRRRESAQLPRRTRPKSQLWDPVPRADPRWRCVHPKVQQLYIEKAYLLGLVMDVMWCIYQFNREYVLVQSISYFHAT